MEITADTFKLIIESSKYSSYTIKAMRLVLFESWPVARAAALTNKRPSTINESLRILKNKAHNIHRDVRELEALQQWLNLPQHERDNLIAERYDLVRISAISAT